MAPLNPQSLGSHIRNRSDELVDVAHRQPRHVDAAEPAI
jgi:hypothetical protein